MLPEVLEIFPDDASFQVLSRAEWLVIKASYYLRDGKMNRKLPNQVHSVIEHGLRLKARLENGERPDIDFEQSRLIDLLLGDGISSIQGSDSVESFANYTDPTMQNAGISSLPNATPQDLQQNQKFLGARYALTSWLDEIFTTNGTWGNNWSNDWTERKLEGQLYKTNDRAWKFWDQAQLAESQPALGDLETYYLCICLGFRGKWHDDPVRLKRWVNRVKLRVGNVPVPPIPPTTEIRTVNTAVPLVGQNAMKRMTVVCWISLLILIPLLSFAITQKYSS